MRLDITHRRVETWWRCQYMGGKSVTLSTCSRHHDRSFNQSGDSCFFLNASPDSMCRRTENVLFAAWPGKSQKALLLLLLVLYIGRMKVLPEPVTWATCLSSQVAHSSFIYQSNSTFLISTNKALATLQKNKAWSSQEQKTERLLNE